MTSTPPNEPAAVSTPPESPGKNTNNNGEGPQPTANGEGYHGYDPVSGLYYYMDNTNPVMYYNGYTGAWLYWSEEGQYYYPAVVPPPAAAAAEGADASAAGATSEKAAAATASNSKAADQKDQPAASKKVPDEDKHPLPFRLTSAVQSERNRVLPAQTKTKGLRMDWADALDNYEFRGFGGRAGGLGHFSNPPILQPRFYYPHQVPGSYYDFLNCRPDASVEEIVNSVQWWQLVGYPKALEADAERAERINRLILEAAVIISNPTLRAQYDQTLPIMSASDHDGKRHAKRTSSSTLAVDPNFVPRVLHFHQDDMANNASGSRSSSRPTSVSSTPSKYGAVGTPGDENNNNQQQNRLTLEDEVSQPNLAERLFAAVSEGIFGPPRTRPKSKKYALRGQEWVDDERRKMMEDDETNEGNAVPASSAFKVTNTSTNKDISSGVKIQQHVDPSSTPGSHNNNNQQAVKPPL